MGPERMAEPAAPIEPGLHLVMGELGRILRSAPIRNAPRRVLQAPFLGPRTVNKIKESISELVLDLLHRDGRVLDSFGWPWTSEAFHDGPLEQALAQEGIRIGRIETKSRESIRVLRVPVPSSAAFLLFSQTAVTPRMGSKPRGVTRRGLALYTLVSPIPSRPKLPDFAEGLGVEQLPARTPLVTPR
jgi:hypothetical protein